jgi:thiol:disulfide interchange protein DsbC
MRIYLMLALLAISSLTLAAENIPSDLKENAKRLFREKVRLAPTPLKGLYEVIVDGGDIYYISANGRYVVVGNIFDVYKGKNLTNERRAQVRQEKNPMRQEAINGVKERNMVVFAPDTKTKYTVNVFTDVDCGYCAKFHQEVPALNEAGVKVRYLAFPRNGVGSPTYKKMVSVWCAKDQQQAMTDAKARRRVEQARCNNPVKSQFELGQRIGITGTPAMVLSNGELVPGYLPADELISLLESRKNK